MGARPPTCCGWSRSALIGLVLGVLCFRAAIGRERRRGTLGHY